MVIPVRRLGLGVQPEGSDRAARQPGRRRVLLVDDQSMFTEALAAALAEQADVEVVGEARTGGEAQAAVRARHPDLVLLEVELADGSGFDLITGLREANPDLLVAVLTQSDVAEAVAEALRRGVAAWLSKAEPVEHLLAVVRGLRPGDCYVPAAVLAGAVKVLVGTPAPDDVSGPLATLTPREQDVMQCMVDGLSRDEIGARLHVSPNTVRTHTQHVLAKLDAHSVVEAVAIGMRAGLRPTAAGR
jgi:DNA-binding NarL/FixJ family response regulator